MNKTRKCHFCKKAIPIRVERIGSMKVGSKSFTITTSDEGYCHQRNNVAGGIWFCKDCYELIHPLDKPEFAFGRDS